MTATDVEMPASAPKYPIESVDNALALLLILRDTGSITVQEASRRLEVAPSTAHRLLVMLQHHGFVEQDPATRAYQPGETLVQIGLAALNSVDIRAIARALLEQLVAEIDETAHLAVLRGTNVLFLDGVESSKLLRAGSMVGESLPAHATASGKALLAVLSEEAFLALYPAERLPRVTDRTVANRAVLLRELSEVRDKGYAVNEGESESDVVAVAAAIRDAAGVARGSITIAGPSGRMEAVTIAPAVKNAAAAVGKALR